jgi:2-polyprenyl-3-methyl-5-hydroxy-6-metoxy-1,4-benzoquinol methylase
MNTFYICRVCGSMESSESLLAREMMFGLEEDFDYDKCSHCGTLQLRDTSIDLSKYYPDGYYSRKEVLDADDEETILGSIKWRMKRWRALHTTGRGHALGALVDRRWPDTGLTQLTGTCIDFDASVLDVGCGAGPWLLNEMAKLGFKNLLGADPFIQADIVTSAGVRVLKREIASVEGKFDLIMFHHSFEHVVDPLSTLRAAYERLRDQGRCLIRIPTPSSEAFDRYGPAWYQLDAPRHLTLVSREGMNILAAKAGFWVESVRDDSDWKQFACSELYKRGIPLVKQTIRESFSEKELAMFASTTQELNGRHRGDQAAFILRPRPN